MWARRELLWNLTLRSVRGQYEHSFLGYVWAVLNPLLYMAVLTIVFSAILPSGSTGGVPFPLFFLVGLVPWLFFANALAAATDSISTGASLITKIYFPREILPVSAVLTKLVELVIGIGLLFVFLMLYGWPFHWTLLWLPVIIAFQVLFSVGLALPFAALNLYYHDVGYLVGVALQLGFFLSPIAYPIEQMSGVVLVILSVNPNTAFINAYRRAVLVGQGPEPANLAIGVAVTLATVVLGYLFFKRLEGSFADRI